MIITAGLFFGTLSVLFLVTYSWTYTPLGRLDYQAAVISRLAKWNQKPVEISREARERFRSSRFSSGLFFGEVEGVKALDIIIPRPDGSGLPARVYTPLSQEKLPVFLDIHGGSWFMGDGYPLDNVNSNLAKEAGVIVVAIEYRLVPEHPYPAALEDSVLSLDWLAENAESIGGDTSKIAVGGGSAGGNLAAALTIHARDNGGPEIAFQFLFVPATDLSDKTSWQSYKEMGDSYMLKVSDIGIIINAYVPNSADRFSPYASPLLADRFEGLPPAFIVTAQFDPLRDQGEAYARALSGAGVKVQLRREDSAVHAFIGSKERMRTVYKELAANLREAFSRE